MSIFLIFANLIYPTIEIFTQFIFARWTWKCINSSNLLQRGKSFKQRASFINLDIEILKVAEIGEAIILLAKSCVGRKYECQIRHHLVERRVQIFTSVWRLYFYKVSTNKATPRLSFWQSELVTSFLSDPEISMYLHFFFIFIKAKLRRE